MHFLPPWAGKDMDATVGQPKGNLSSVCRYHNVGSISSDCQVVSLLSYFIFFYSKMAFVCVCVFFQIIFHVNCFVRTVLYIHVYRNYNIIFRLCIVSAQGIDACMINVHYYYHFLIFCYSSSIMQFV